MTPATLPGQAAADLHFGQRVRYQGQPAEIVDICRRVDRTSVQIRIRGQRLRWVAITELEAAND
jgi:hypothetical protein